MPRIFNTTAFVLVIGLFVALRIWKLTDSCLWFDEIFSLHAATNDWNNFFEFIAADLIHPPLFYAVLKFWLAVFGESLFALRILPVIFALLSIVPLVLLARELRFSSAETCVAIFVFAINGSLIKYAQTLRMYSLLILLSIVSYWLFAKLLNKKSRPVFIVLLIANVLLTYTHFYGWFVVISQIGIAALSRKRMRDSLISLLVSLVCFLPWCFLLIKAWKQNRSLEQNLGWAPGPDFSQLFLAIHQPISFAASSLQTESSYIAIFIALISLITIVFFLTRHFRENIFLLTAIVVPAILSFFISAISPFSVWGTRHLTIIFVPYFLLLSAAILRFENKYLRKSAVTIGLFLIALSGWNEFSRASQPMIWCAWENFAMNIAKQHKPQAQPTSVYVFEDLVAYHFWNAFREADAKTFRVVKLNGYADMKEDAAYFLPRGFNEVGIGTTIPASDDNFWIAFRDERNPPLKEILVELNENGFETNEPLVFHAERETAFAFMVKKQKATRSSP